MNDTYKQFWQNLWTKYKAFCRDLGIEQGACRGCVPIVKFDPERKKPQPSQSHHQS